MQPEFSVLVVCLNPGEKLKDTLASIERQTFSNYEIVVKDGCSTDGSMVYARDLQKKFKKQAAVMPENAPTPQLHLIEKKDEGIYDAMNQAAAFATGRYLYYLNCGDIFYNGNVLQEMSEFIAQKPSCQGIYYGNIFERLTGHVILSNPHMDAFGCYRNVPCHQACFYDKKLLLAHPFNTKYKVRADYEQFLWCFFENTDKEGTPFFYRDILIADYEGGGFSETKENSRISKREHREIVHKYMSRKQIAKYRLVMWLTLAPLRTRIAQNKKTAGIYNRIKKMIYGRK